MEKRFHIGPQHPGSKNLRITGQYNGERVDVNHDLDGGPITTEERARVLIDMMCKEIEKGEFHPTDWKNKRKSWFKAKQDYIDDLIQNKGVGKRRLYQIQLDFETIFDPYWGGKVWRPMPKEGIRDMWKTVDKNQAPRTLRRKLATFKAFLRFHDMTFPNFPIKVEPAPKKKIEFYTQEEQAKILGAVEDEYFKKLLGLLFAKGTRVEEACLIERAWVNSDKKEIRIPAEVRKNKKELILSILQDIEWCLVPGPVQNVKYIFCKANGKPFTRWEASKKYRKAVQATGLKHIPLKNATRHSLGSQLANMGYTALEIASQLGNSPGVCQTNYCEISREHRDEMLLKRMASK